MLVFQWVHNLAGCLAATELRIPRGPNRRPVGTLFGGALVPLGWHVVSICPRVCIGLHPKTGRGSGVFALLSLAFPTFFLFLSQSHLRTDLQDSNTCRMLISLLLKFHFFKKKVSYPLFDSEQATNPVNQGRLCQTANILLKLNCILSYQKPAVWSFLNFTSRYTLASISCIPPFFQSLGQHWRPSWEMISTQSLFWTCSAELNTVSKYLLLTQWDSVMP